VNKIILATAALALAGSMASALAGDAAAGKSKFAMCMGCHGPTGAGNAAAGYPSLIGKEAAYVTEQLHAFKSGKRVNPIMQPMTATLSPTDIDNLAAHIATLK